MYPSDWRKAATLVSQHKEAAATAATDQLNSMPLSEISIDDSGPPVVHYGSHMPVATSTPTGTITHMQSSQLQLLMNTHFIIESQKVLTSICKMQNSCALSKITTLMVLLDL